MLVNTNNPIMPTRTYFKTGYSFIKERNKSSIRLEDAPMCKDKGKIAVEPLNKKPIVPQEAERLENPASRSAKFRAMKKIAVRGL